MTTARRRLARSFPLLIAAACALALTACGGPSKGEYEDGLARVKAKLDAANEASQEAAGETDEAARTAELEQAQQAIEQAAELADGLEPPDDVEKVHAQLAGALHDYAKLFGRLATLEDDDPDRAELYGEAGEIVDRLDSANRALKKAGYEVAESRD